MDPYQTAPFLIWAHTVCKNDFYHKQMIKQTTVVVIGSLGVNKKKSTLAGVMDPNIALTNHKVSSSMQSGYLLK